MGLNKNKTRYCVECSRTRRWSMIQGRPFVFTIPLCLYLLGSGRSLSLAVCPLYALLAYKLLVLLLQICWRFVNDMAGMWPAVHFRSLMLCRAGHFDHEVGRWLRVHLHSIRAAARVPAAVDRSAHHQADHAGHRGAHLRPLCGQAVLSGVWSSSERCQAVGCFMFMWV